MKSIYRMLIGAPALLLGAAMLVACDGDDRMIGKWETVRPALVFPTISGTVSSIKSSTLEFSQGPDKNSGGVTVTTEYKMTLPADSTGVCETSVVLASVDGTWTREDEYDDELVINFDKNSLDVDAENVPELTAVTDIFLTSLAKLSRIDAVEVTNDNTMLSFEDRTDDRFVMVRMLN